jgi:hypothetical protein
MPLPSSRKRGETCRLARSDSDWRCPPLHAHGLGPRNVTGTLGHSTYVTTMNVYKQIDHEEVANLGSWLQGSPAPERISHPSGVTRRDANLEIW